MNKPTNQASTEPSRERDGEEGNRQQTSNNRQLQRSRRVNATERLREFLQDVDRYGGFNGAVA